MPEVCAACAGASHRWPTTSRSSCFRRPRLASRSRTIAVMRFGAARPLLVGIIGSAAVVAIDGRAKRYDPATHTPVPSAGCGKAPPYAVGRSTVAHGTYEGTRWTYRIYLPSGYSNNEPIPIIFQFPGWGMSAKDEESGCGITARADELNFISVTPQGTNDNPSSGGPWYSWNAVGSTQSPGKAGPTCTQAGNHADYCYMSCGVCKDEPQCDWTSCDDSITPTGTGSTDANGFIHSLYDTLEEQLCVDTTREFAAGESNGGMMAYQTGVVMGHRLAALFPQFGSFHRGFNLAPPFGLPVMDLHGTRDNTVPANISLSGEGYYYTTTDEIFFGNQYSSGWAQSNGCTGTPTVYHTSQDGLHELWCVSAGDCPGGDVVRCSWNGGHNWFGNSAENNGQLVTEFLLKWTRPSHQGRGYSVGQLKGIPVLLEDIEISAVEVAPTLQDAQVEVAPSRAAPPLPGPQPHYGDPDLGCLPDEDAIYAAYGRTCAPTIGVVPAAEDSPRGAPPVPQCRLGGVAPFDNGCPKDFDGLLPGSKAFPVCLAKGDSSDPYMDGQFHCLLACPCSGSRVQCDADSDAHCPGSSRCRRGELLNLGLGICTYHNNTAASDASAPPLVV
mmetsp:Transcript_55802/g.180896  ORF Transcript_55802/g.180896 Transcript_55802/m.180896 type:complete len:613 (+) Transcript_55802:229-2067(+)